MNRDEFKAGLLDAHHKRTLLTFKHDPQSVGTQCPGYRTIVVQELANDLEQFIQSNNYNINYYTDYQNEGYFEIEPTDPAYSVPASGIPARSPQPTTPCDRLVVVSGHITGWHIYGEKSQVIQHKVNTNKLTFKKQL